MLLETLSTLGERRIIEEILRPRYGNSRANNFGDDCASVVLPPSLCGEKLVATTDPCPQPMAALLGYKDYYYYGWLLATINLSDIAAAGALPIGLLTSLTLPNSTSVDNFYRLLDGIDACCERCGTHVIGGNLKEAESISLSATALGVSKNGLLMSRKGAVLGEVVVVLGEFGNFWAGALAVMREVSIEDSIKQRLLNNVLVPHPKVALGHQIAQTSLLTCCMDNSDGLYATLSQLAFVNNIGIVVDADAITYDSDVNSACSNLSIEPIRCGLGWGDWQIVGTVPNSRLQELKSLAASFDVPMRVIGTTSKSNGVQLLYQGRTGNMNSFDSERFTKASWFSAGIDSYVEMLTTQDLWTE